MKPLGCWRLPFGKCQFLVQLKCFLKAAVNAKGTDLRPAGAEHAGYPFRFVLLTLLAQPRND